MIRVCLLGGKGSGKTTFLAGLAVLSEPDRDSAIRVRGLDPASCERLDELARTLRAREWPPATTRTRLLNLRLTYRGTGVHVTTLDYSGDSFVEELRKLDAEHIEELWTAYLDADVYLLLFDPERDLLPADTPDSGRREAFQRRALAHLEAIEQAWNQRKGPSDSNKEPRPRSRQVDVVLLLTKSDRIAELQQADHRQALDFFQARSGQLLSKLRATSDQIRAFPVSAVGGTETVDRDGIRLEVPAETLHPTGYEGVFGWIVKRHRWRRGAPVRRAVAGFTALLLIAGFVVGAAYSNAKQQRLARLQDDRRSTIERIVESIDDGADPIANDVEIERARIALIDGELETITAQLAADPSQAQLDQITETLDRLLESDPGSRRGEVERLRAEVEQIQQRRRFGEVQRAFDQDDGLFPDLASSFLDEYPEGNLSKQVKDLIEADYLRQVETRHRQIAAIRLRDPKTLRTKAEAILAYIQDGPKTEDDPTLERMRRAAEVALRLAEPQPIRVQLKRSGRFDGGRHHRVKVWIPGQSRPVIDSDRSDASAKAVTWINQDFLVNWNPGQPLRVEWYGTTGLFALGSEELFASTEDRSILAIETLDGPVTLSVRGAWRDNVEGNATVLFRIPEFESEDWEVLREFVSPGTHW